MLLSNTYYLIYFMFFFSSIIYVDYYDITIALLHYYISKQHSHLKEILN